MKRKIMIYLFLLISNVCSSQSVFELGRKEYLEGDLNKSIQLLTESINLKQEVIASYILRGASYGLLKEYSKALSDLDFALTLDSNNYKVYYQYGRIYFEKGFFELSIKYFDKAINKSPSIAGIYDDRAISKALLNKFEESIIDENMAISLDSNNDVYYTNRGYSKLQLKQYKAALKDFNSSLKIMENQKAFANRGITYSFLGMHKNAIEDYTKSLQIKPQDPEVFYYRGVSYNAIQKKAEACLDLKKSKEMGYNKAFDLLKKMKCD